jgi:hypothetical protein
LGAYIADDIDGVGVGRRLNGGENGGLAIGEHCRVHILGAEFDRSQIAKAHQFRPIRLDDELAEFIDRCEVGPRNGGYQVEGAGDRTGRRQEIIRLQRGYDIGGGDAILGEPRVWMQLGVRNDEAATLAEEAGLKVVMNRCPKIEYGRLSGEIAWAGVNTRTLSSRRPTLGPAGFQKLSIRKR